MTKTADLITTALATPIGVAVVPMRAVAMDDAEARAKATIARVAEELATFGGDVNAAAPYADHRKLGYGSVAYHKAKARYALFHGLVTEDKTKTNTNTHRMGAPYFVVMSANAEARHIEQAREFAAAQYDMYVLKLNRKVGEHVAAVLEGNHVWGESFLTVTFAGDKPAEVWKTHRIWNVSVLGKDFPQWPSRKVKGR